MPQSFSFSTLLYWREAYPCFISPANWTSSAWPRGGFGVAHQLKSFAKQVGALEHPEVQEVLTRLDAALGLAASPAEVARALSVEAREAQEVIAFAAGDTTGSRSRQVDGTRVKEQIQELQEEVRVFREELENSAGYQDMLKYQAPEL